jgi:uncharacterized membrane protein
MSAILQRRLSNAGVLAGVLVQVVLVLLGIEFAMEFTQDEPDALIFVWCLVATIYAAVMIAALSFEARESSSVREFRPSRLQANVVVRVIALASSLVAGVMGVAAAFLVVVLRDDPTDGWWYKGLGVWAMVLSWGVVHWGFAQWYFARYYATEVAPMEFPGTSTPHLVDFVYFSYTIGTTLAASDVTVLSRDLRWRVTVHGVLGFFFNSAIIVLALSTLTGS